MKPFFCRRVYHIKESTPRFPLKIFFRGDRQGGKRGRGVAFHVGPDHSWTLPAEVTIHRQLIFGSPSPPLQVLTFDVEMRCVCYVN